MPWPHDPFSSPDPAIVAARTESAEPAAPVAPKGTSHEVLTWVAGDKERAQLALDAEHATNKPRKGLVEELEEILGE